MVEILEEDIGIFNLLKDGTEWIPVTLEIFPVDNPLAVHIPWMTSSWLLRSARHTGANKVDSQVVGSQHGDQETGVPVWHHVAPWDMRHITIGIHWFI